MSLRSSIALLTALLLCPSAALALGENDHVRLGVGLGVVGVVPIGDDVSQEGTSADEFQAALSLAVEFLTFDIGQYVQVVPFFRASVVGGANGDVYEEVVGSAVDLTTAPETRMSYWGLGARFFPVRWGDARPFLSGYVGYVGALARYTVVVPASELIGISGAAESWRHTGIGFTFGLGLRWDFPVTAFGEDWIVPLIIEGQWTKNVWLDLELNGSSEFDTSLLAPESMNLDALGGMVSVGWMF